MFGTKYSVFWSLFQSKIKGAFCFTPLFQMFPNPIIFFPGHENMKHALINKTAGTNFLVDVQINRTLKTCCSSLFLLVQSER